MIVFWRATKAAIARFPPAHQSLIWERRLVATGPAAHWRGFVASVQQHDRLVRRARWALPPRTVAVLVPLIRALSADLGPKGKLTVTADLRGAQVPDKQRPVRSHPVRPPFRSAVDSFAVDPWLQVEATLRDGSAVRIVVVDTIRSRRVVRTNPRGKVKAKTKVKATQRIAVTRRFGRQQHLVRPAGPPPPWIAVRTTSGDRAMVRARAKVGLAQATQETEVLLTVLTEVFRWTPARPGPVGRRGVMPPGARCGLTTGFFVLGTCGRPAVGSCPHCERWLCADHAVAGGPCPECASAQDPASNHPLHPLWLYGRRRAYYRRSSEAYGDPGWYAGFDTFDRRGFEGHAHGYPGPDGPWDADDGPFRDSDDDGYGTDS